MFVLPRLSHYSDSRGQALKDSRRHLYLADVFPLPYSSRDNQLLRPWVGVKVHGPGCLAAIQEQHFLSPQTTSGDGQMSTGRIAASG